MDQQTQNDQTTSLFEFMLRLRTSPLKVLQPLFPNLDLGSEEPRNLSREHKGTPDEFMGFMIVFGFGDPLKHVVAVAFHSRIDVTVAPPWADDHDIIERVYGVKPTVLVLSNEQAYEDVFAAKGEAGEQ